MALAARGGIPLWINLTLLGLSVLAVGGTIVTSFVSDWRFLTFPFACVAIGILTLDRVLTLAESLSRDKSP